MRQKVQEENLRQTTIFRFFCLSLFAVFFGAGPVCAGTAPYSVTDFKVFRLQERSVVSVAIEDRIPGKGIDEVLDYRIDPAFEEKRLPGRLEVTLNNVVLSVRDFPAGLPVLVEEAGLGKVRLTFAGPEAGQTTVSTVRRKTVKARDGMIRMRTYLVINIPKGSRKEVPTVVLDAGHGGDDTGAVKNFIKEKDINLDITLRAARLFESKGWNVVLTRRDDVEPSLLERADAANIVGADVFISIHNNSLPEDKLPRSREFGTTVLYNASAVRPAFDLAAITQDELIAMTGTRREVMQDRPKLVVLNSTWVPAILTEGVMLPNPANAKMILDRIQRQRSAEAIVRAVENWRGKKVLAAARDKQPPSLALQIGQIMMPGSGNTAGNSANHGTIAEKAGWIYYLRKADSPYGEKEETLWRFRPDRILSDQLLADVEAWDINLVGEWIYFANWSDDHALYKVKTDGFDLTRIADGPVQQLTIVGDRLIFVRNRQIYSMPRDGGMAVRVSDDVAENVMAWGEWIYYANGSDGFRPYRIKEDGTGRSRLANDETLFLAMSGEWLFYSNLSDEEKLYRIRPDGTGRAKVSDDRVGYINVDSRFVYFSNPSQGNAVFRIRPDGTDRLKLATGEGAAGPIGIVSGKLYYRGMFYDLK